MTKLEIDAEYEGIQDRSATRTHSGQRLMNEYIMPVIPRTPENGEYRATKASRYFMQQAQVIVETAFP
jgi:hypothetical protein